MLDSGAEVSASTTSSEAESGARSVSSIVRQWDRKINHFLGTDLAPDYMERILTDLGCTIADGKVTAPSWRDDLGSMNDIAEEVIRIYGEDRYDTSLKLADLLKENQ